MAPIVFPLLVKTLADFLNEPGQQAQLLNCPVASQVPNPRPDRYIALFSVPVGGAQRLVLSTRRISAQVNDVDEFTTGTLTETVAALLVDAQYHGLGIKRVNIIGQPARFPGPGQPNRWQTTADFLIRAKASVL